MGILYFLKLNKSTIKLPADIYNNPIVHVPLVQIISSTQQNALTQTVSTNPQQNQKASAHLYSVVCIDGDTSPHARSFVLRQQISRSFLQWRRSSHNLVCKAHAGHFQASLHSVARYSSCAAPAVWLTTPCRHCRTASTHLHLIRSCNTQPYDLPSADGGWQRNASTVQLNWRVSVATTLNSPLQPAGHQAAQPRQRFDNSSARRWWCQLGLL